MFGQVRPSSRAYVERRLASWRRRDDPHKGSENDARAQAEKDAARFEAMGSVYDLESESWSPVWLRINPTHGQARRDARDALKMAMYTAGGGYDREHRIWKVDDPSRGNCYLLPSTGTSTTTRRTRAGAGLARHDP